MRNYLINAIFIILACVQTEYNCCAKESRSYNLSKDIFEDGPKVWGHYIRRIISLDVRKRLYKSYNFQFSFYIVFKNVKSFLNRIQVTRTFIHPNKEIVLASGEHSLTADGATSKRVFFNLHFKTSLKVTFPMIYVGTESTIDCHNKFLEIKTKTTSWYCGFLPQFDYFGNSRHISIRMVCMRCKKLLVEFKYTLIDNNIIESRQLRLKISLSKRLFSNYVQYNFLKDYKDKGNVLYYFQKKAKYKPDIQVVDINLLNYPNPLHVNTVRGKLTYLSHYIQIRKMFQMLVFVKNASLQLTVFDGPGTNLKLLKDKQGSPTEMYFITSTFQCILYTFLELNMPQEQTLRYRQRPLNYLQKVKVSDVKNKTSTSPALFTFPNHACSQMFCLVYFHTSISLQINISLLEMKREGLYKHVCSYAGAVSAEYIGPKYREGSTQCEDYGLHLLSRSFYSSNSSLLLLVYWYKEFSQLSVAFTVTVSKCRSRSVNIDPCYYRYKCLTGGVKSVVDDFCKSYLLHVAKFSGTSFTYIRHYLGTQFSLVNSEDLCGDTICH